MKTHTHTALSKALCSGLLPPCFGRLANPFLSPRLGTSPFAFFSGCPFSSAAPTELSWLVSLALFQGLARALWGEGQKRESGRLTLFWKSGGQLITRLRSPWKPTVALLSRALSPPSGQKPPLQPPGPCLSYKCWLAGWVKEISPLILTWNPAPRRFLLVWQWMRESEFRLWGMSIRLRK